MKYVVLVKLRAPSGISVYYPLASFTTPNYPLPPPTTLAGALAYPYLRTKESSEVVDGEYSPTVKILDKLVYASAGAEGWVQTREIERIYQHIYLKKQHWAKLDSAYSIGVKGITFYLNDLVYLFYVVTDSDIVKYTYGIVRVGRKESLVSVEEVYYDELNNVVKAIGKGTFETYFYFPREIAVCQNAEVIPMPKIDRVNFGKTLTPILEDYCISNGIDPVVGELKSGGALVRIEDYDIPIPRSILD